MSPETQHLESFFAPTDNGEAPPGFPSAEQQEVAEFTRFFERLSTIDDMTWFSPEESGQAPEPPAPAEPSAPPTATSAFDAELAAAGAESRPAEAPAQPGMQVFRSGPAQAEPERAETRMRGRATAGPAQRRPARQTPPAAPDGAAPHEIGEPAPGGFNRAMRQVGRGLGIALLGSVLFAAGLGMGALVLSIPKPTTPSFQSAATTDGQPAAEAPAGGASGSATAKVAPTEPTAAQPEPTDMVAPDVPSVVAEGARPAEPQATPRRAADPAPATPAPAAPAADASGSGPRFALQVGACGSFQCVQQFRELLLGHVTSDAIQVVPAGGGDTTLQRVRVEPLSREAATQLKAALADTDARFTQAYLVALK